MPWRFRPAGTPGDNDIMKCRGDRAPETSCCGTGSTMLLLNKLLILFQTATANRNIFGSADVPPRVKQERLTPDELRTCTSPNSTGLQMEGSSACPGICQS